MNGAARKYLFDRSFAEGHGALPLEAVLLARIEADHRAALERARSEAFALGEARGRETASAETEARIAHALDTILATSGALAAEAERRAERLRTESAALALAAASRLAGELIRRAPSAEIEALFADCLAHLDGEHRVTVRVPDAIAAALNVRLSAIAARKGFAGHIAVQGEAGMEPGDCRIEWADGGAARDWRKLLAAIEQAVTSHFANGGEAQAQPGRAA